MLTLASWASIALIVIALVNLGILGGLVYLIFMVRRQVESVRGHALPIMDEARSTFSTVRNTATQMAQRTETMAAQAEEIARDFSTRAEQLTSDLSQRFEHVSDELTNRFDNVSSGLTESAQRLLTVSEQIAERVASRVDTATTVLEDAVTKPLISLASVRAGINKGLEVWREFGKVSEEKLQEKMRQDQERTKAREEEARRMIERTPPLVTQAESTEG